MKKYRAEKLGVTYVEASSEEEARQVADELPVEKWEWRDAEVEEWD